MHTMFAKSEPLGTSVNGHKTWTAFSILPPACSFINRHASVAKHCVSLVLGEFVACLSAGYEVASPSTRSSCLNQY